MLRPPSATIQLAGDSTTGCKVHGDLVIAEQPLVHWRHFMLCATTAVSLWRRCSTAPGHRELSAGAATGRRSSSCSVLVRAATASQPSSCRWWPAAACMPAQRRVVQGVPGWMRCRWAGSAPGNPCALAKQAALIRPLAPAGASASAQPTVHCSCRRCPQQFWSEPGIH